LVTLALGCVAGDWALGKSDLSGRSILVLEDEPLIARDIIESLQPTGANVPVAGQLPHAPKLAADTDLSAAVVDYKIGDAGSAKLYWLLKEWRIPFLFYSGLDFVRRQWPDVVAIEKPATPRKLAAAVAALVTNASSAVGARM
jgi:DNA-binding response OmpR family regulator